jgi:hypothetical protein
VTAIVPDDYLPQVANAYQDPLECFVNNDGQASDLEPSCSRSSRGPRLEPGLGAEELDVNCLGGRADGAAAVVSVIEAALPRYEKER